jgi:hypothetical protein
VLRALIGALALAALLAAASGCGGSKRQATTQGATTQGPTAQALVQAGAKKTSAVKSFHFTLDVQNVPKTTTGIQLTGAEGDVAVPDRARADVTGTFAGTAIATQIVAIGEKVWLKNPLSGTWQPIDVSTTPLALLDPAKGVLGVMSKVGKPTDVGTEDANGVTLRKISGTASAADVAPLVGVEPSKGKVPVTLWIGEKDHLLRRIEVHGPVAEGEPKNALRVIEVSRFDEPVTIRQPEGTG